MSENDETEKPKKQRDTDEQQGQAPEQSLDEVNRTQQIMASSGVDASDVAAQRLQRDGQIRTDFEFQLAAGTLPASLIRLTPERELLRAADESLIMSDSIMPPSEATALQFRRMIGENTRLPEERHAIGASLSKLHENVRGLPEDQQAAYNAIGSALIRGDNGALQRALREYGADPEKIKAVIETLNRDLKSTGVALDYQSGAFKTTRDGQECTIRDASLAARKLEVIERASPQTIAAVQGDFLKRDAGPADRQAAIDKLAAMLDGQVGDARAKLGATVDTFKALDAVTELAKASKLPGIEQAAQLLRNKETFDSGVDAMAAVANGANGGKEQAKSAQEALTRMFMMDPSMPEKVLAALIKNAPDGAPDRFNALKLAQQLAELPDAKVSPELKQKIAERVEAGRKAEMLPPDKQPQPKAIDFEPTAKQLEKTLALAAGPPPNQVAEAMIVALAGGPKPGEPREKTLADSKAKLQSMIADLHGNDADKKAGIADRVNSVATMISDAEFSHRRVDNVTYGLNEGNNLELEAARTQLIEQAEEEEKTGNMGGVRNAVDRVRWIDARMAVNEFAAIQPGDPNGAAKAESIATVLAQQSAQGNPYAHTMLNDLLANGGKDVKGITDEARQRLVLIAARQLADESKSMDGALDKADAAALASALARVESNPDANPELKQQLNTMADTALASKPLDLGNGVKFDGRAELVAALSQAVKDGKPGSVALLSRVWDRLPEGAVDLQEVARGPGGAELRAQIQKGLQSESADERRIAAKQLMAYGTAWNEDDVKAIGENISPELAAALQEMPGAVLEKHRDALVAGLQGKLDSEDSGVTDKTRQAAALVEAMLTGKEAIAHDEKGRITDMVRGGVVTRFYYGEGDKPISEVTLGADGKPAEIRRGDLVVALKHDKDATTATVKDAAGKVLLQQAGQIAVDEKTGSVTLSSRGADMRTTETKIALSGTIESTVTTIGGLMIEKRSSDLTKTGVYLKSASRFEYAKADGQPATSPQEAQTVREEKLDASGRVTNRFLYAGMDALQQGKPVLQENIAYSQDAAKKERIERRELFDLTKGAEPVRVGETVKTSRTDNGEVTVRTSLEVNGVKISQTARFNNNGQALALTRQEGDQKYDYVFDDAGNITSVKLNGGEGPADRLAFGDAILRETRRENDIQKIEKGDQVGPTAPRHGTEPNGTLVYKDETGQTRQVRVENGKILDGAGKQIGTMQDSGEVALTGKPAFRIADAEGAAFHGLGSDLHRLDLVYAKDAAQFRGIFKSFDGKVTHEVIGGNVYTADGKFVGRWRSDERSNDWLYKPDGSQTLIASEFSNAIFTGKEGENKRELIPQGTGEASTGRIFIPNEQGQPVEYVVRAGMLIDKHTGAQKGFLTSPAMGPDLRISGGTITLLKPDGSKDTPRALQDVTGAVFELRVNRGGTETPPIQGVSLGSVRGPDGQPVPGAGGFFSRRALEQADRDRTAEGQRQVNAYNDQYCWSRWWDNYTGTRDMLHHQLSTYQQMQNRNNERMNAIFSSGKADPELVGHLNSNIEIAKMLTARDRPDLKRVELDNSRPRLEQLPENTSQINGAVKVPIMNEKGEVTGHNAYTIKDGQLLDASGKLVGRITKNDGQMVFTDPKTGKTVETRMMDLKGAVWNLKFKEQGVDRDVHWVSVGANRGGVISVNGLRMQAGNELNFAAQFNRENESDKSKKALEDTKRKLGDFEKRLQEITTGGIKSEADLKFIAEGVKGNVRSLDLREGLQQAKRGEPIGLPNIKDRMQEVNGTLRLGPDVYEIKQGKLMQVTYDAEGKRQVATTPSGQLNADFSVELTGRGRLNIGDVDRAFVDLKVGNESFRLLSLGQGRATQNFGYQAGGLYDVREFKRQIAEAKTQAEAGNREYFKDKPWLTGSLASNSWLLGDVEDTMRELSRSIDRYDRILDQTTERVFKEGFDPRNFNTDRIDGAVRMTQLVMSHSQSTAADNQNLSAQAGQVQKQINDAAVTAIITVATAGIGSYFSAAATAKNISSTAAVVGRIGFGTLTGGAISTAGRMTQGDLDYILGRKTEYASTGEELATRAGRNFVSGSLEGLAMSAGGALGEWGGQASLSQAREAIRLARAGQTLEEATKMTLQATKVGRYAAGPGATMTGLYARAGTLMGADALMQTTLFHTAGAIRDSKDWNEFGHRMTDAKSLAWGTAAMMLGNIGGLQVQRLGDKVFSRAAHSIDEIAMVARGQKSAWDGLASATMNNTIAGTTNALVSGIPQAFDAERQRIASELGISKDFVQGKLFSDHMKTANIVNFLTEQARWGGATGALTTFTTHAAIAKITAASQVHQAAVREAREAIQRASDNGEPVLDAPQMRKAVNDHVIDQIADARLKESVRKYVDEHPGQPTPTEKQLSEWLAKQSTDKPAPKFVEDMTAVLKHLSEVGDHADVMRTNIVADMLARQQTFEVLRVAQNEALQDNPYMAGLARHKQFEPKFEFRFETQPGDSSKFNLESRRITIGADLLGNPQLALEIARHETQHAQQYLPIRLAAEIERNPAWNPGGHKQINLVGDRVTPQEQRQITAYLERLTPQERRSLLDLGRQFNMERLGAESSGMMFARAHEDFMKNVAGMMPEQAAQARKELMNNWLGYKFQVEEVRAAFHGEANPRQNELLQQLRNYQPGTPEHTAALEAYVQFHADAGMLPRGLSLADAKALLVDVNAGKMRALLQPEISRNPALARGVLEGNAEPRLAARTVDEAVENIRGVRSDVDDRALAYSQSPSRVQKAALEADLLRVGREQAKRMGLDPDNLVPAKIKVADLPDGVRGSFGASEDVLTFSLPKGIAPDQVIPTIVSAHEMRHRQHAIERTAFAKADPEGFRMAVADEVFLNTGAGGSRAVRAADGKLVSEPRLSDSPDAPPQLRIHAEQREYMRSNLREFVRRNGENAPSEAQLTKWLLKQNGTAPEAKLVGEMVRELHHYKEVLKHATLSDTVVAKDAGLRREIERKADAITRGAARLGPIGDNPALQKLIRSISDDTTGIARGGTGEYVFSVEEIRARRMELTENLRRLVAEQRTNTDMARAAEINKSIEAYKDAIRFGNSMEDVTRDMRAVRQATEPAERAAAQKRLEESAARLLSVTPDSMLETVSQHLAKQGALKPEQVLAQLPIADAVEQARAMVKAGVVAYPDLLAKLPANRMMAVARDVYGRGAMSPAALLASVPQERMGSIAQMMMTTKNPHTGAVMTQQQIMNLASSDAKLAQAKPALEAQLNQPLIRRPLFADGTADSRLSGGTKRTPEELAAERATLFELMKDKESKCADLVARADRLDEHVLARAFDPQIANDAILTRAGFEAVVNRAEALQALLDRVRAFGEKELATVQPAVLDKLVDKLTNSRKEEVQAFVDPVLYSEFATSAEFNAALGKAVDMLGAPPMVQIEHIRTNNPERLTIHMQNWVRTAMLSHLANAGVEVNGQNLAKSMWLNGIPRDPNLSTAAVPLAEFARRQATEAVDPAVAKVWNDVADAIANGKKGDTYDHASRLITEAMIQQISDRQYGEARRSLTEAEIATMKPDAITGLMRAAKQALQYDTVNDADLALAQRVLQTVERMHGVAPMQRFADIESKRESLVPNFDVVNENIMRGGKPKREAVAELKSRGVETIIDLSAPKNQNERGWAGEANVAYFGWGDIVNRYNATHQGAALKVPFGEKGNFEWRLVTPEHFKAAAEVLNERTSSGKVFVHCDRGIDRTGIVIAEWQRQNGVPLPQIAADLIGHGFSLKAPAAGNRVPELLNIPRELISNLAELPSAAARKRDAAMEYNLARDWSELATAESRVRASTKSLDAESRWRILTGASNNLDMLTPADFRQAVKSLTVERLTSLPVDQRRQLISNLLDAAERRNDLRSGELHTVYMKVIGAIESNDSARPSKDQGRKLPRSLADDLAYLRPDQLDKIIRHAAQEINDKPVGPKEKSEVQTRVERLATRLSPTGLDRGTAARLLNDLSPADRDAVVSRLVARSQYLSEAGLRQMFRNTMEQLQLQGAVHTGYGSHGLPEMQITVVANTTEGKALAYLFRKMTGAQVHILEPGEKMNPNTRSVVSFDPSGTTRQPLERPIAAVPELAAFHDGVNLFHLQNARMNPQADEQLRTMLGITAQMRDKNNPKLTQEDTDAVFEKVNRPVLEERRLATARGLLHLARSKEDGNLVANAVDRTTEVMSTARAMLHARRLYQELNSKPEEAAKKTVYAVVAGQDNAGRNADSAYWAMQIFREANGLAGREHDHLFLTEAQLKQRLASQPNSMERIVILQDAIGSGKEAFETLYRTVDMAKPNHTVRFAALGATADGFANLNPGNDFVTAGSRFSKFGDPSLQKTPETRIEKLLAGLPEDHPLRDHFARSTGWDENSANNFLSGYAFPHMYPNSAPERMRLMLQAMGLRGAYSERRLHRSKAQDK